MSQLCRAISIFLILGVSTLEVKQTAKHSSPTSAEDAFAKARPKLTLQSPSLDKIGSNAFSSNVEQLADASPSGGSSLLPHFLSAHFTTSTSTSRSGSDFFVSIVLLWVLIAVFFVCVWGGFLSNDEAATEVAAGKMSPTIASREGFWACKYQESDGENKEALALLLRCHVVEKEELTQTDVSQEHVEECLWIAKTMLKERPLEEWVALSQDDRQWFQDSVAAVFEARARVQAVEAAEHRGQLTALEAARHREQFRAQAVVGRTMLQKDASTVSLGSAVSFAGDQEEQVGSLPIFPSRTSNQLPFKSPVAVMNCGDVEDDASSEGSTTAGPMEDVFPSVFSSSTFSSPQESLKAPESPFEPSALRLPPRDRVRYAPGVAQSSASSQSSASEQPKAAFAVLPVAFSSPRSPMGTSQQPGGFRNSP